MNFISDIRHRKKNSDHCDPLPMSFSEYWQQPHKKKEAIFAFLIGITSFLVLKYFYPFPDFFSDSYAYIDGAAERLDANIWPIGYSKFLILVHAITHSATFLVWFQYIIYLAGALYCYTTADYFFNFSKAARYFIVAVMFANPLLLYTANYVTSDILFCGLSLVWFTQLLWMLKRPRNYNLVIHAVVLFLCFTIRYNAMYYPLVALPVILLVRYKWKVKLAGILLPWIMIIPFIIHSRSAAKELTGTAQFPILGGWQWGNNALYMYEHIDVDNNLLPTPETRELDLYAKKFFKETPYKERDLPNYVANYFIRQANAPLKKYMTDHYHFHDYIQQVEAWGRVSPIYGEFGKFLAKKYPFSFLRYYMLMNAKNYFLPPLEKLEVYNLGQDHVWEPAVRWFDWESDKVSLVPNKFLQGLILAVFPSLFLVLNLYFLYLVGAYVVNNHARWAGGEYFAFALMTGILFFLCNMGFSVFANIIVIRYQIFPMLLFVVFIARLSDVIALAKKDIVIESLQNKTVAHA